MAKRHLALAIPHHGFLWLGRLFALLVMLLVGGVSVGVWWLQQFHRADNPLSLTSWVPQFEKMLGGEARLQVGTLELYYDRGIVVHAGNLTLRGSDGNLAVVMDDAAVRFSRSALFRFKIAPRSIDASNVTLRLIRHEHSLRIAGLGEAPQQLKPSAGRPGVVGWLNGLAVNDTWGWLESIRIEGLTVLMRDEDKNIEWIVQDANVDLGHAEGGGEHGSLVAEVRRIGADGSQRTLPALITFDHTPGADIADLRARFSRADVALIADYLPPQVSDLLKAEGTVELGTTIDRANRLGEPWVTLRLRDVTFSPGINAKGDGYTHKLNFSRLTLTASYQPAVNGVSGTDLLTLHDVQATYKGLETIHAKGWVQGVAGGDPRASLVAYSTGGDAQSIFDFLPDAKMDNSMPFLRHNIRDARLANIVLTYDGRPASFPMCGEQCGVNLRGNITRAEVNFADEMPTVTGVSGTVALRGQAVYIRSGPAQMGPHKVGDIDVAITNLFVPGPTYVVVSTTATGPLPPLLKGLSAWLKKDLPTVTAGTHSTAVSVTVPFQHGVVTSFETSTVAADVNVRDVTLDHVNDLPLPPLQVSQGNIKIAGNNMSVKALTTLKGQTVEATLMDALHSFGDNLKGQIKWPEATLDMNGETLTLTGKKLDLTPFDLGATTTSSTSVKNMNLVARVDEVLTREAKLENLNARLISRAGHWEINTFTARVGGNNQVNFISSQGADKRRKLKINIDNAGQLFSALGLYRDLRNGQVFGEINYDTPDIGAGVLQMRKFELTNPPVLVKLLGLLSLTQLIAGTDSTLFDTATIPLRFDHDLVTLDNVTMEGPSMSIRLNGTYNRASRVMDIDGQMAPAIPFNRLVGQIPLLGTLLTGGQDGVVVADFRLKGNSDDPDVSVKPLSVITPGLLKGIFRGITGGGAPQPKPQVIDGRSKK